LKIYIAICIKLCIVLPNYQHKREFKKSNLLKPHNILLHNTIINHTIIHNTIISFQCPKSIVLSYTFYSSSLLFNRAEKDNCQDLKKPQEIISFTLKVEANVI